MQRGWFSSGHVFGVHVHRVHQPLHPRHISVPTGLEQLSERPAHSVPGTGRLWAGTLAARGCAGADAAAAGAAEHGLCCCGPLWGRGGGGGAAADSIVAPPHSAAPEADGLNKVIDSIIIADGDSGGVDAITAFRGDGCRLLCWCCEDRRDTAIFPPKLRLSTITAGAAALPLSARGLPVGGYALLIALNISVFLHHIWF